MKVLGKKPELCIQCHACESICSKTWFKEDNALKSCIRISEDEKGGAVIISCTQCGECIDICPVEAIKRDKNGIVRIDKSICVGCFMCVGYCPELAMFMHEDYLEPFKCIACGQCAKSCPTGAIFITQENA
ncbi:MAG TPA: 4Fe-4S binding protein [Clostridia bacterium]|nr:4Fe-4S binding protein [Clostridia bacterium]